MDVPAERIFSVPYAVDNDFFQSRVAFARGSRDALRAELGLEPGVAVILYASKLEVRKRPMDLLRAFEHVVKGRRQTADAYLVYAGDGSERCRLETAARNSGLDRVRFLGFRNQTDLPGLYDLADVFVLPSQWEPWGLVINEVMNAAKPVIVTDTVGAAADLVEDGRNGFVVPMGDISSLANRIDTVLRYPEMARKMGDHSLRKVSEWNFGSDAEGLLASLRATERR
jgi:glycosyltransferase involved in cell wall biosynthesis